MPNNFEFIPDGKYEVGNIKNFLVSAKVNAERKTYTPLFHTLYALVCALLLYVAMDAPALGAIGSLALLAVFAVPALCTFTFLYGPMQAKILPVILPVLLFGARLTLVSQGKNLSFELISLFTYMLCILCAAVFTKSVISGYTKNVVFVAISVCGVLIIICELIYITICLTGSFSLSALSDMIYEMFLPSINASSEALFNLQPAGTGEITKQEFSALYSEAWAQFVNVFLPSFLALSGMFYAFISIGIFSLVANKFKIDVFVCIMDTKWSYRPSKLSTNIYDIMLFAFIIAWFIKLPANISAAIINIFVILTPLLFVASVKCIYTLLCKKTNSSVAAGAIVAGILLFSSLFFGVFSFCLITSIGITFLRARYVEEKRILPIKLIADKELYEKTFANNQSNSEHDAQDSE